MKSNIYENFLNQFSEEEWFKTIEKLSPEIHEVDRNAARIWFRFYPLALHRFLEKTEDKAKAVQKFVMQGDYELADQIDSSHDFLYGHRFWKDVKTAIEQRAANYKDEKVSLTSEIKSIAETVSGKTKTDKSLLLGIASVGLMTLVQTGFDKFKTASGEASKPKGLLAKSPNEIVKKRNEDKSQGVFGFLKTVNKEFNVFYDETTSGAKFPIIYDEEIAGASAKDQSKNWREMDQRCGEGVIPVECRSAACGTCWVGILGGEDKLSEVADLERKRMKSFGYNQTDEAKPFMRLACQAKAYGNVHLVIPPWNGVFGKKIYGVEEVELKPATTSAKKLRDTIKEAVNNE